MHDVCIVLLGGWLQQDVRPDSDSSGVRQNAGYGCGISVSGAAMMCDVIERRAADTTSGVRTTSGVCGDIANDPPS